LNIEGAVVTTDSLHTQKETARYLVEEKKADYVFTVKDNQPTLSPTSPVCWPILGNFGYSGS